MWAGQLGHVTGRPGPAWTVGQVSHQQSLLQLLPSLLLLLQVYGSLREQCLTGLQNLQNVTECGPVSWVM
jgi:hypothetical protein